MRMSVVKMPSYELYWAAGTSYDPIAYVMSRDRYKKVRRFLHANDNFEKDKVGNKENRLFKVQPIFTAVRQNCLKVEQERRHSIDEQIIPAKTKLNSIIPKKTSKWGFKNFVRVGASGMIYDFFTKGRTVLGL